MEADIRRMAKRRGDSDSENEKVTKKPKGPSLLEQGLAKYSKSRGTASKKGQRKDESDTLAALSSFRSKIRDLEEDDEAAGPSDAMEVDAAEEAGEAEGLEVDDDRDWIRHRLHFKKDDAAVTQQAQDHYEVIDPRARGRQAADEQRERRQQQKDKGPSKVFRASGGGGGRR